MKLLYLIRLGLGYCDTYVANCRKRTSRLSGKSDNGESEPTSYLYGTNDVFGISGGADSKENVPLLRQSQHTLCIYKLCVNVVAECGIKSADRR